MIWYLSTIIRIWIAAAEAAASRDFEVTPVNPERFAVHKKIAMYNLGVK